MFCLKRPDFPVDTHVWKIAMTLGWIPKSATRDTAYEHLNRRVPDACKFDLHVLLVEHGKVFKNDAAWLRRAVSEQPSPAPARWAGCARSRRRGDQARRGRALRAQEREERLRVKSSVIVTV